MKKLSYRLENRKTGEVFNYDTVEELCNDPNNFWIKVSIHTLSRIKRGTSYANKFCIVTKYDTDVEIIRTTKVKIKK